MKLFGQLSELVKIVFRQNGQAIELDSNASTTYTATRVHQLPPGDSSQVLVSATSTQTLTGKTIDGDDNTVQDLALTSLKTALVDADKVVRRDASGVVVSGNSVPNNSPVVTTDATQTLTGKTIDGDSNTVQDLALSSLKTELADANKILQRDAAGAVISGAAIPAASGDIVTLNATQTLTNKTLTSPAITTPTGIVKGDVGLGNVDNTSDATKNAAAATLTNKTIDGDDNTIQDLALASLKTELADADKVIRRNASGVVISGNALPNSSAIVTTDASQALTAKDIDGGTASNTSRITIPKAATATLNALTRKQGTLVYDTDVNKLKYDDGSILNLVGSGSGAGSINYVLNPDAEENTLGWATYADAAGVAPVDGTGGSPNVTFTRSTSSPLRGTASFLFTKDAANRQGQGASYDFTIASADASKTLQISFDFENTGASYAAGDLRAYIYDVTNAVLITPAVVSIAAAKFQFQTTFVASTSTSYRLILHVASTNASAYTAKFDNVVVGPQLLALGTAMEDSKSITLTISASFGTSSQSLKYQRIGAWMRLQGVIGWGTTTGATTSFTLPSGFTIDYSALANQANRNKLGRWNQLTNATFSIYPTGTVAGDLFADGTSSTQIFMAWQTSSNAYVKSSGTDMASNNSFLTVDAWIPIAEWASSSVYLSGAQPEFAFNSSAWNSDDITSFAYGPQGASTSGTALANDRFKRVRFLTPIQPTDIIKLEFSDDRIKWSSTPFTDSSGSVVTTGRNEGGINYGARLGPVTGSNTDIDVYFALYRNTGGTYGAAGAVWGTQWYWRVVKVPGQVQVASPVIPTATSMSDVSATALGLKVYTHTTAYNGGITPTFTMTSGGITSAYSALIPYQTQDGNWRMRFNIFLNLNAATSSNSLTINGVSWLINPLGGGSSYYPVSHFNGALSSTNAYVFNETNTRLAFTSTTNRTDWGFSGDAPLNAKPSWAY
jgi:hypothetical protein